MERETLIEAYEEVFEKGEYKNFDFLGFIADGYSSSNYDIFLHEEEVYIIDWKNNRFINWYKLSHIGRCLRIIGTDPTKEDIIKLFKDIIKDAND